MQTKKKVIGNTILLAVVFGLTIYGVFHGEDAYEEYLKLQRLSEDLSPGNLEHPIFGIRHCYLTLLEVTQEPKENYVSYRFEFTQAKANGEVPK